MWDALGQIAIQNRTISTQPQAVTETGLGFKKSHFQNIILLPKTNKMLDNKLILLATDLQFSRNKLPLNQKTEQSLKSKIHEKELISNTSAVTLQLFHYKISEMDHSKQTGISWNCGSKKYLTHDSTYR